MLGPLQAPLRSPASQQVAYRTWPAPFSDNFGAQRPLETGGYSRCLQRSSNCVWGSLGVSLDICFHGHLLVFARQAIFLHESLAR